jgi:hypothetical protein
MLLPTTRHVKELIEHSEEHLSSGSEKDMKIALVHVDNSIEIMLKEYLRYQKEKKLDEIEDISFYGLLNSCSDISVVKSSKSLFIAFHDMRNAIYHLGNLLPSKEDVESAIELAKSLFNEIHPQAGFKNAEVTLPSKESIKLLYKAIGERAYINEITAVQDFSAFMRTKGYEILIEHAMGKEFHYRADLIATKNDRVIVCEFKSNPNRADVYRVVSQLKNYLSLANNEFSDKKIEGWLIFFGGKASSIFREIARKENIKLLDSNDLLKFYAGEIEF